MSRLIHMVQLKRSFPYSLTAVLNSYSILFFSTNKILALLLLLVSFFNPISGLTGFLSVILALTISHVMGYNRDHIRIGLYSFNALLLGVGFGTFYGMNLMFWIILAFACLFTIILSIVLSGWLGKYGLPFLSIPFILTFWIVLLATSEFTNLGLDEKNIGWLNEMQATGNLHIEKISFYIENLPIPAILITFFRSLSAIFFQDSVLTGILMSIGLLIHSRIGLTLLVLGFTMAILVNNFLGADQHPMNYYHFGANFMMSAVALGSFFLIPSIRSYFWACCSVPIAYLLVMGFTKIFATWNLPVFSLPFCITVIVMLYFFMRRVHSNKLQLTQLQYYSPELNLYQYLNGRERLQNLYYLHLYLPFIGEWTVSQGYDGNITHKGDWSKALDFVILDEELKTYASPGTKPENFYCFNKPVLACADGIVEEITDLVDDNAIGQVNTVQNWGNSIVIRHSAGLYSKLSHLKKNSVKVKRGDFVRCGDVLAACGNSGRSPEPHLHFQMQATPFIGSKTLQYPFAYFLSRKGELAKSFNSFRVPDEGMQVSHVETTEMIKEAFAFQPGYQTSFKNAESGDTEEWEVFTDDFNQSYIHEKKTGSTAYFVKNSTAFYFTSFYGDHQSMLYYFYLAAYKIILTGDTDIIVNDNYPLHLSSKIALWFQDFVAPFYQFIKLSYQSTCSSADDDHHPKNITLSSVKYEEFFGIKKEVMQASINLAENAIQSFNINHKGKKTKAQCITDTF